MNYFILILLLAGNAWADDVELHVRHYAGTGRLRIEAVNSGVVVMVPPGEHRVTLPRDLYNLSLTNALTPVSVNNLQNDAGESILLVNTAQDVASEELVVGASFEMTLTDWFWRGFELALGCLGFGLVLRILRKITNPTPEL